MPSLNKRTRGLSVFLAGVLLIYQPSFAAQDDRPPLNRQTATRKLVPAEPWLQENFPNPVQNPESCNAGASRRLCDPDGILSSGISELEDYLEHPKYVEMVNVCGDHETIEKEKEKFELQMGVALVKKVSWGLF
jgi:Modulator of levamisole receptor-1